MTEKSNKIIFDGFKSLIFIISSSRFLKLRLPVSSLTHYNRHHLPQPAPAEPGTFPRGFKKQTKWPPMVMTCVRMKISHKNLNTHHHISWEVFTSPLGDSSGGWPLQVVNFFCENSKFSLKSMKLPLVVATTSSGIDSGQWRVDGSCSAAWRAGRWRSAGQNWTRVIGIIGGAWECERSFFRSRFTVSYNITTATVFRARSRSLERNAWAVLPLWNNWSCSRSCLNNKVQKDRKI